MNKINNADDIGIYIDIPFCKNKCSYCDFPTYVGYEDKIEKYIQNIVYEIANYDKKCIIAENGNTMQLSDIPFSKNVSTIYIGGGTPSYIKKEYIGMILSEIYNSFNVLDNAEITIEVNPDDVADENISYYKKIGINRISMGLQSMNDNILKSANRRYDVKEFNEKLSIVSKYIENISVDIILGLPYDNLESFSNTIESITSNDNIKHISVYEYILSENSRIYNNDKLYNNLPTNNEIANMKKLVKEKMKDKYIQYEISNYAKSKKYICKHNYNCWIHKEYLSFGLSAASFLENYRFSNSSSFKEYNNENNENTKILLDNKLKSCTISHLDEKLNLKEYIIDYMFVKLRIAKGLTLKDIFRIISKYMKQNNITKITKNEYTILKDIITFLNKYSNYNSTSTKNENEKWKKGEEKNNKNMLLYAICDNFLEYKTSNNFNYIISSNNSKSNHNNNNKKKKKSIKLLKNNNVIRNNNNTKKYISRYHYISNPKYISYSEESIFPKILDI